MSAYDRWVAVSGQILDTATSPQVLEVIRAASAAMAELHDEIARLEREKAGRRPERVRAYEDRPGPLRGYRGVRAHLDP